MTLFISIDNAYQKKRKEERNIQEILTAQVSYFFMPIYIYISLSPLGGRIQKIMSQSAFILYVIIIIIIDESLLGVTK